MDNQIFLSCLLLIAVVDNASSGTVCSSADRRAVATESVVQEPKYLTSPGWKTAYFSNMDCQWKLNATGGERIIVDVMESYMEGSPGCTYDFLGLYDGNNVVSAPATRLCNNMRYGQLFVSSGSDAVIRLKSDFSVNYPGFYLRWFIGRDWSANCSSAVLYANSTVQYLTSPGFPDLYDKVNNCSWRISSNNSRSLRIEVILLDMIAGEVCYSDHLIIYDGRNPSGVLLADLCDSSATFIDTIEYTTNGTSAFIQFITRLDGRSRRGFLLSYNETDTVVVSPTTTTTPAPARCSASPVFVNASSTTVYISSPDYPLFYSVNMVCQWTISGPIGTIIQIKVIDFYLEDSAACISDSVTIYDGATLSYPQLLKNCGEISHDVNTTGNTAMISFVSDGSSTARGFKYEIKSIDGGTPACVTGSPIHLNATTNRQYIQSRNYPNNYGSDLREAWLIYNTLSSEYEIVIETVDSRIENSENCLADKVQLFHGPCTSYPSLGTFCGLSTPTYVQSNGLYVLITFKTDSTDQYRGFNMSYYLRKVTTKSFFTKEVIALILGLVFGLAAFTIIAIVVYKKVISKRLMKWKKSQHGSRTSLSSNSSSSSSSSSDSDSRRRHRKPINKLFRAQTKLSAARYILKATPTFKRIK